MVLKWPLEKIQQFLHVHSHQIEIEDLLGESFCQKFPWDVGRCKTKCTFCGQPCECPIPWAPNTPLLLLKSAPPGEGWTDDEVIWQHQGPQGNVLSHSSADSGWRLGVLRTLLGNMVATWTLFVPLTEELWTTVGLFKSSMLPRKLERKKICFKTSQGVSGYKWCTYIVIDEYM